MKKKRCLDFFAVESEIESLEVERGPPLLNAASGFGGVEDINLVPVQAFPHFIYIYVILAGTRATTAI